MARISPLMIAPPAIFAGLAALFFVGMQRDNPDELPSAMIGREAPAVAFEPVSYAPGVTDADLRDGDVTLVNFWASWCAPCRAEHPQLVALAQEGIDIVGVNFRDEPAKAQRFIDELGNPFAFGGADPNGRNALDWGVAAVPETFVVDGEGKVLMRIAGPLVAREMERVRPLLVAAQ